MPQEWVDGEVDEGEEKMERKVKKGDAADDGEGVEERREGGGKARGGGGGRAQVRSEHR